MAMACHGRADRSRCPSMGPRLKGHPTLWPPPTSESAPEACAAPLPTSPGPGPVALPGTKESTKKAPTKPGFWRKLKN